MVLAKQLCILVARSLAGRHLSILGAVMDGAVWCKLFGAKLSSQTSCRGLARTAPRLWPLASKLSAEEAVWPGVLHACGWPFCQAIWKHSYKAGLAAHRGAQK